MIFHGQSYNSIRKSLNSFDHDWGTICQWIVNDNSKKLAKNKLSKFPILIVWTEEDLRIIIIIILLYKKWRAIHVSKPHDKTNGVKRLILKSFQKINSIIFIWIFARSDRGIQTGSGTGTIRVGLCRQFWLQLAPTLPAISSSPTPPHPTRWTYLTMGAISQLVSALVAGSITTPSFVITATSNWNMKKSNLHSNPSHYKVHFLRRYN